MSDAPDIFSNVLAQDAYGPVYSAQYGDAVRSAKANELGHRLGIPGDIVESDMPNMLATDRLNRAIAHAHANAAYAQMMANPRLAASGIDDKHLPAVAAATSQHQSFLGSVWQHTKNVASSLLVGTADVFSTLAGAAHGVTEGQGFDPVSRFASYADPFADTLRWLASTRKNLEAGSASFRPQTSGIEGDIYGGIESIPTNAAALAATILGGPETGAGFFGGTSFGQSYERARKEGLSPNQAANYGAGDAAIAAGTSFLPEKYLGGALQGKGGAAKGFGVGLVTNEVMAGLQAFNHWLYAERPKGTTFGQFAASLPAELGHALVQTVVALGITSGATHLVGKLANRAVDTRANQSVDKVMEAAAKSSTRQSNPTDFEHALNQLVGDSNASDIYVPAEKVSDLFTPQEGKPERNIREDPFWQHYADQVEEAGALGSDVVIPLSAAATHLAGSPDWAALREHVRTRPGGASMAEVKQAMSPEEMANLAQSAAHEIDRRVLTPKAQGLTRVFAEALGYKAHQADAVSQLLGAGLSRAYALERAKREAHGEPVPTMEQFAAAWLPDATRMTQAEYDAAARGEGPRAAPEAPPARETAPEATTEPTAPGGAPAASEEPHAATKFDPHALLADAVDHIRKGGSVGTKSLAKRYGLTDQQARKLQTVLAGVRDLPVRMTKRGLVRKGVGSDVISFVRDLGGIRDNEGHDLTKGRGWGTRFGLINNKRGLSIDEVGEHLQQAGYFHERPTEADVIDMIERAHNGAKIYPLHMQEAKDAELRGQLEDKEQDDARFELQGAAEAHGLDLRPEDYGFAMELLAHGFSEERAVLGAHELRTLSDMADGLDAAIDAGVEGKGDEDARDRYREAVAGRVREALSGAGGEYVPGFDEQVDRVLTAGRPASTSDFDLFQTLNQLFDETNQPERSMTPQQRAELEARMKQSMARRGEQKSVKDQEGGLFSSERDQDTLFQPAYHGSKHIFDRFSLDHIGSGEGAQAYGWGLYFAGNKDVAAYYREALSHDPEEDINNVVKEAIDYTKDAERDDHQIDGVIRSAFYRSRSIGVADLGDNNDAIALVRLIVAGTNEDGTVSQDALDAYRQLEKLAPPKEPGRLYHVEIPDDGEYLLWDEPLYKQTPRVREAVERAGIPVRRPPAFGTIADPEIRAIIRDAMKYAKADGNDIALTINNDSFLYNRAVLHAQKAGVDTEHGDFDAGEYVAKHANGFINAYKRAEDQTGEHAYISLSNQLADHGLGARDDKAASLALRDAGVPGIKYLDGFSRHEGEGSHNYVLFDDSHAQITDYEHALNDTFARGNISIERENGIMTGAVIRAFEHADFSTAVHEMGHFFLEDLKRRALRPDATDQEKADWQTAKEWMGGVGDDNMIPEASHESFARGFERYIYEGNAPSIGLKSLFGKMRDFMLSLYRSVRSFNAPITPEIRKVMDRLLASDEEIKAREDELRLGNETLSELMSKEESARYAALGTEARGEARDKLFDRVLSTIRAERTRKVAQRKAEIRQDVGDQIKAQPVFRALKFLRGGVPQEDGSTERATLPRQWLVDNYGEAVLDKLPKGVPPIYDDKHGVDPEGLAQSAGFESADQMVQKLLAHEEERQNLKANGDNRSPQRAMTEQMTEERLRAEMGDPFANLEEEADDALANDRQADRLSMELRALSRATGGKKFSPWKVAKDWARAHVRSSSSRDAISGKALQMYSKNAAQAAQRVEEALAAKDHEAAFRAKQQQVLNLALMREAKAAKDEVMSAVKRMRRIAKAKTIASVDQDYLDQAHQLLEAVDMKNRPAKEVAKRLAFEAWHAKQVEMEVDPVVPPDYRAALGQTHWSHLSINDLLDLDKAVKQITKLGRLKQELLDGKKKREYNEGVAEMQDVGGAVPPRKPRGKGTDPRRTWIGRTASRVRGLVASQIKAERLLIWADNWQEQGPWWRMFYGPFAEAQGAESDLTRQYAGIINPIIKGLPKATVRSWTRWVDTPELVINNPNHSRTGGAWHGTKDQVVLMALNWGNLGNRQRLLDGFGWSEEDVAKVFDRVLTKDDWDFVQSVWDSLEVLRPHIAKVEREVNGVEPEWVEPASIDTPHGTYRGGYFPIVYDPMETTAAAQAGEDKLAPSGGWWSITTRASATKERAEQVKGRPLLLSMDVITRHVGEVIHDITHRQAVNQARKLLGDKRVTSLLNSRFGPEYIKSLKAWMEGIARPNTAYSRDNDAIVNVARYLNKATTTTGLGFRLSTSLVQSLGIPFSSKDLGVNSLRKGFRIVTAHPVQAYKEMLERSAEMRARSDALDDSIMDMVNDHASGKLKTIGPKGIAKYAFQGIAWMDVVSRTTVWTSAYNKALEGDLGEDEAVKYADRIVRESHGIGFQKDRSGVQRATPWARMWYQFFSYQNALFNAQADTIRRFRHGQYAEAFRRSWWVFVVPAVLHAVMLDEGPDDDTVEGWAKWLGKEVTLGNLASIPIVGSIAKAAGGGYDYRGVGLLDMLSEGAKGAKSLYKWEQGESDLTGSAIKSAITAVGELTAKPLGQIGATSGGLYDYATGRADPQTAGDWYNLLTRGSIPPHPTAAERIAGHKD